MLPLNVFRRYRCFQRDERLREDEFGELQEINTICYDCLLETSKQITLECGHTMCKDCLQKKRFVSSCCTVCWEYSQLRNHQVDIVMYPEGEGFCEMHREDLKFFCDTNKVLLCVTCSKWENRENHIHWPIEVAAFLYRKYILKCWKLLKEFMEDTQELIMEEEEKTMAWAVQDTGYKITYWRMSEKESLAIQEQLLGMKDETEIEQHEELIVEQMDETFRELYQTLKELEATLQCKIMEEKKKWEAMIIRQSRLLADVIQKSEEMLQKPNMELLQDVVHRTFHRDYQRVYDQQIAEPYTLSFDSHYYTVATQFLQYFKNLKSPERFYFYSLSGDKKRCIMVPGSSSGDRYAIYITGCEELEDMIESWKKNDIVSKC